MIKYIMNYLCERCGQKWQMQNDCACDDRCPSCDLANEPLSVEECE